MNIVLISYDGYQGPGVIHMHHFANELVAQGHAVLFLLHGDVNGAVSMSEAPAYQLAAVRFDGEMLASHLLTRAQQFRPDIVHAWTPRNVPARAGLEIALATGARLLIHYEDDEEAIYAQFVGDLFADPERYAASVANPLNYGFFHPVFSPDACNFASGFTAISPPLVMRVEHYWVKPTHMLYPGVNLQHFSPTLPPDEQLIDALGLRNKTIVVYTGAISELHDFDQLLQALALLLPDFPDLMLLHVGRVFTQQALDDTITRLGVQAHVRFAGAVMHKDIPRYLSLGRVLVQTGKPNAFNESRLPSKLPEYMAMGRPIVTFSVGFGRMLRDGGDVLKTYTDDPVELAARLRQLLTDPDLCTRLGTQARVRAQELFDWRENTAGLLRFYAQVCSASAPADVSLDEISQQRFARSAAALDEVHVCIAVIGASERARQLVDCISAAGQQRINFATLNAQRYDVLPGSFELSKRPTVIVFADAASPVDAARYVARIVVWEQPGQKLPAAPQPTYDLAFTADAELPALTDALIQSAWQAKPLRAQQPAASARSIKTPPNAPTYQPYRNALSYALAEVANNYEHGGMKAVLRYGTRFISRAGRRR